MYYTAVFIAVTARGCHWLYGVLCGYIPAEAPSIYGASLWAVSWPAACGGVEKVGIYRYIHKKQEEWKAI